MVAVNDNSMPKWCSVKLSQVISRGKRLEASVFDVDALRAWETARNGKYPAKNLIGNGCLVERAYYGGRLKRNYVAKTNKNAIGFIGSSEMLDMNPHPVKFMLNDSRVNEVRVKEGQVLISRSGTIGNLTYVGKTLSKYLVSEHAIRLDCPSYPGYVYAYLKSDIGQLLIHSNTFGAVIPEVEPEHLASIPVPDAPYNIKAKIDSLIKKSFSLRDEANSLNERASATLISELHLPTIEELSSKESCNSFQIKLSDMNGRLDGSYHIPIVNRILKCLRENAAEVTTIGDSRISSEVILPGRFKRIYVNPGFGQVFIGGKQIWELDPANKKYLSIARHKERIAHQLTLHKNMVLITCSGTIGKVALVGKQWENWTANQHIIRVVPSTPDIAGYLSIYLATDYGRALIVRNTYGSVVDEIDDHQVRQVAVPLLKDCKIQDQINELALEANRKSYEAYQLEQEALQLMNEKVIYA